MSGRPEIDPAATPHNCSPTTRPPKPAQFRHRDNGIAVRVRIVWDGDGEEYVEGTATRWDADHVYVEVRDNRLQGNGVWVKPSDVYRRSPEPPPDEAWRQDRRTR